MTGDMLPLDEVATRVGALESSYVGVRPIPTDRIVGTLDRSVEDFDRRFKPRRSDLRDRLAGLRRRYPGGDFPSIQVVELGDAYFVIDGHHRVALARSLDMAFVDAEVTSMRTTYEIPPDVDVPTLVHTDQVRRFELKSGIGTDRAEAPIRFSRPQGYPELLEIIQAWAYRTSVAEGCVVPFETAAARWYAEVYAPGVAALNRVDLPRAYEYKTDADLFLWVYQLHRASLVDRSDSSFDDAARQARGKRVDRRFKRRFLRERSRPLEDRGK